jgi:hypothetical protein
MMQDGPVDFVHRAAEKFLAANRAEGGRQRSFAARLTSSSS